MRRHLILMLLLMVVARSQGQTIEVQTSLDTVLLGNVVTVQYMSEDVDCDLDPDISNLPLYTAPSRSSSVSIVNGIRSSKQSISFRLLPQETGVVVLPAAQCDSLFSPPVKIIVLPNPNGVVQEEEAVAGRERLRRAIPTAPKQAKRRLRKI